MSLRMGDGPIDALPAGLDAYAGYVNVSGIGITYPQIVATFPRARHLSITTDGSPADCADVERGAMTSWKGYRVGYAGAANVGALIARDGRPPVLWTAHYTDVPHVCTSARCWPSSPVEWEADGTQWTDHGGAWDESLLTDRFFPAPAPSGPTPSDLIEGDNMLIGNDPSGKLIIVGAAKDNGNLMVFTAEANGVWAVVDVTDKIKQQTPQDPRTYAIV